MTTMVTPERWQPAVPAVSLAATVVAPRLPDFADVRGIISRTMRHARALGRDDLSQTRAAAEAVMAVRPDMTLSQAMMGIERLQASGAV
jgi:hypothetical protein